jgi:hypothetical protein
MGRQAEMIKEIAVLLLKDSFGIAPQLLEGEEPIKPHVCAIILTCILLSGCSGLESVTGGSPPDTVETLPSISNVKPRTPDPPTPTYTQAPTATTPPPATFTPSPSPTSPTPTATWVVPTLGILDPSIAIKWLDSIPSGPEGCFPPCWNGLTPGISPASDIPVFLAQFGIDSSDTRSWTDISDSTLKKHSANLDNFDTNLKVMFITSRDRVEDISLFYYFYIDLFGTAAFLHPMSLIDQLGDPDSAKLRIFKSFGGLGLIYSEYSMAIRYQVDVIQTTSGESKICLMQANQEQEIVVVFSVSDESYNGFRRILDQEVFQAQEAYTGMTLSEFLAELSIPGRCIPVQIPDS